MAKFKFLNNNPITSTAPIGDIRTVRINREEYFNTPNTNNIVSYFRDTRPRESVSDLEYNHILEAQRRRLMSQLYESGRIMHYISYQGPDGYTLVTEILTR